jgi:hypothetical protein
MGSSGVRTVTQAVTLWPVASLRRQGGERKGAPATQRDVCPALAKRARRAEPGPQHGLASRQRDRLH